MCEVFSPHQAILHDTSWVSYNLIQFGHRLPRESVKSHRLRAESHKIAPTWPQMPISSSRSPGYLRLLFDLDTNQRFPQPPPQIQLICYGGSQNSGKHLMFISLLKKLLSLWVEVCHLSGTWMRSPTWKFSELLWFFWRLHHVGMIDHELHFQPFFFLERMGAGLKFQVSNRGLVFLVTSPHPGAIQEPTQSHLIRTKDALITREITRFSGTLCQELGSKTKYENKRCS